jgi:hypothetical protein
MNISYKHKTIWWAPERTGTKITREILSNFDFFVRHPKYSDEKSLKERTQSHLNVIPEEYSNYKVICNIRNPYSRVFGVFLSTQFGDKLIDKGMHYEIKIKFNKWINDSFVKEKNFVKLVDSTKKLDIDYNFFSKWNFDEKIPDNFIRVENLSDDLSKLDFIKGNSEWDYNKIHRIVENNRFIRNSPLKFDENFDYESAKIIYFYYKKVFHLIQYDPFSFSTKTLSDKEKYSFLHDIL